MLTTHVVSFEELSRFDMNIANDGDYVSVRLDLKDESSEVARLYVELDEGTNKQLVHTEVYDSPVEFATVTMKQALTLFVKRGIISRYPNEYRTDDPRVHCYVSKLSYESIKYVAGHLDEFAKQFKNGNITMNIPRSTTTKPSLKH